MVARRAVLLALLACTCSAQQVVTKVYNFPFFKNVGTCAPFSYLIQEAKDGKYSVEVVAEQSVIDHLIILVEDDKSVGIQSNGTYSTTQPVKITVRLPSDQLQYIETTYVDADIGVDVSFSPDKAEFTKNGNGNIYVARPVTSSLLKISAVGGGNIVMTAYTGYAEVTTAGTGTVYLSGPKGTVSVRQSETGSLLLNTASTASIQGVNIGSGPLTYTQGKCNVTNPTAPGGSNGASVCKQASSVSAPSQALLWTCGLQVQGPFICAGGGFLGTPSSSPLPCAVPDSSRVMLSASANTQ